MPDIFTHKENLNYKYSALLLNKDTKATITEGIPTLKPGKPKPLRMHSFFICLLYHCHEPDSLRIVLWSYAITRHCMTVQTAQSDTFIVKIYDKFMSV